MKPGRMIVVAFCMLQSTALATAQTGRNALAALDSKDWDRDDAAHLLRRAGFGGTPGEIDRLHALGLDAALASLLDFREVEYECPPPAMPALVQEPPEPAQLRALSEEERAKYLQRARMAERRAHEETRIWWIERLAESPRPLEEKMTLFWHGHFTSGAREVKRATFMKAQNELLRRYALGNFRDLLLGVCKDPAMLAYLDGNRNVKTAPNENFARELMELYTLGVGNYSEADVKAAARAFTGWSYDDEGYVFRPRLHDFGNKTFLGRTGEFDGGDIVDIILEQQACTRHLAGRILRAFVRPEPEKPLIEALARELIKNKYELRPTMRTLFRSQAFYHPDSVGSLVKSPVQLLVGVSRELDVTLGDLVSVERALSSLGQEPMQPPNVKGWPGGTAWINTATLYNRYNHVGTLIQGGQSSIETRVAQRLLARQSNDEVAAPEGDGEKMGMQPKSRLIGKRQPAFQAADWVKPRGLKDAGEIVDFFAAHLLARPLSGAKRDQLVAYLDGESRFDIGAAGAEARMRTMLQLLCSTPEFQLY